jgi:class 3 adenylate cyclase
MEFADPPREEGRMICPRCGANIANPRKFCGDCGSPLPWQCSACGSENPPDKPFCADCGAAQMAEPTSPRESPSTPSVVPTVERRHLTVMFADLVGSTALGARLDPEDLREVIAAYHSCVKGLTSRFGGFVARYLGDGVLVYFGYPHAHEDDAERSVRAGLTIVEAVDRLNTIAGPPGTLRTRISIATGLVVVGDMIGSGSSLESSVVGDTPNLAAGLQSLAEPGTVVIADSTRQLAGGLFEYRELGSHRLKGRGKLVEAWAVLGESAVESRFEALRLGQVALVGRSDEVALMVRRWDQARAGEGRVVLLSADAGMGKSRLIAALEQEISDAPYARIRFLCSSYYQDTPLHPIVRHLERTANFQRGDPPSVKLEKLRRSLALAALSEADIALVADLLSLGSVAGDLTKYLTPQRMREMLLSALLRQIESSARQAPVLAVFEDIHWADPTTLELLALLVEAVEKLHMLLVVTTRPGLQLSWAARPQVTVQMLSGFSNRQAALLIKEVTGNRNLPEDVIARIVARADGVPLFIEELTKAVLEKGRFVGVEPISVDAVPSSLQDSLMARLDGLGVGKEVAQMGSVVGREFSFEMLHALSNLPTKQLQHAVRALLQAGLVTARGRPPVASYTFTHALVQDAAYASLLRDRRRAIHLRVAQELEKDPTAIEPQLIAWHFGEGGAPDRAIDYFLKAAEGATGRFALSEKVSHLRKGLEQLADLPDSDETRRRELALQLGLGRTLIDQRGSGSDEVDAAFERAREICLAIDEMKQLLRVHDGLMNFHFTRSGPKKVLHYVSEMLEIARRTGDPQAFLMARRSAGYGNLVLGRFEEARDQMQLLIDMYETERDGPHAGLTTRDPKVSICTLLGICLTAMGYPDSGATMSLDGVTHAESLNHPISLILGLRRACVQRMMQKDTQGVIELSARLLAVNTNYETFLGTREGAIFDGWARLHTHQDARLLEHMQTCLEELDTKRFWAMLPFFLTSVAELKGKYGDPRGAVALLDRAAELSELTDERWCEAEILRMRACVGARDADEAASLLQTSLGVARNQRAKLWELRTAVSLAKLWREQGRHAVAHDVLAPIYSWLTEGFKTSDVMAARALLDELGLRVGASHSVSGGQL